MIILLSIIATISLVLLLIVLGRYTFWLPSKPSAFPRILMLHQVNPDQPASGMNIHPDQFEQLLLLLVKRNSVFTFVSELDQYVQQKNVVALTFDDGFVDNYLYAFPLLKKYNVKATIYLATHALDEQGLTATQITEMVDSGIIEFGAHTQRHVNLLNVSESEALVEIQSSKADVERLAGSCKSFAYPYGRFTQNHENMVRESGFVNAVSTRKKIEAYGLEGCNIYRLPRISINGEMNRLQMVIALSKGRYKL